MTRKLKGLQVGKSLLKEGDHVIIRVFVDGWLDMTFEGIVEKNTFISSSAKGTYTMNVLTTDRKNAFATVEKIEDVKN